MRRALLLAAVLIAPGCIGLSITDPKCPPPEAWVLTGPFDREGRIPVFDADPQSLTRILLQARNPTPENVTLDFFLHPPGSSAGGYRTRDLATSSGRVPPNGTLTESVSPLFKPEDQTIDGHWRYDVDVSLAGDWCKGSTSVTERHEYVLATPGEHARRGVGTLVQTAGFWTNGTLFYTNMQRVHDDANISKAGWYAWEGADPLKVYVYNTTRTELPPRYNQSGYATTIQGFNRALGDLFVGTSGIAILRPEEAYTLPGRESHPLYGDALVFYIEVLDVVAIDCPYPEPVCEAPQVPPPIPVRDPFVETA